RSFEQVLALKTNLDRPKPSAACGVVRLYGDASRASIPGCSRGYRASATLVSRSRPKRDERARQRVETKRDQRSEPHVKARAKLDLGHECVAAREQLSGHEARRAGRDRGRREQGGGNASLRERGGERRDEEGIREPRRDAAGKSFPSAKQNVETVEGAAPGGERGHHERREPQRRDEHEN